MSTEELLFPSFEYYLDESDPDIMVLRRQDGAFVAAFSKAGATSEGIIEAARDDYRELILSSSARRGKTAPDVERQEIQGTHHAQLANSDPRYQ